MTLGGIKLVLGLRSVEVQYLLQHFFYFCQHVWINKLLYE